MSTTIATSLSQLAAEAEQLEQDFREKRSKLMARIRELAKDENEFSDNGNAVATPAPKRGRPKLVSKTEETEAESATADAPKGRRGRPKGSKNKTSNVDVAKTNVVKPNERNYDNKISLREAIWQVLDQGPDEWAKHIPDLPEDAEGLKVSEIREIIDMTKIWESSSDNISNQVQQHLFKLSKVEKKIARGKDRRYYIVEGAEL